MSKLIEKFDVVYDLTLLVSHQLSARAKPPCVPLHARSPSRSQPHLWLTPCDPGALFPLSLSLCPRSSGLHGRPALFLLHSGLCHRHLRANGDRLRRAHLRTGQRKPLFPKLSEQRTEIASGRIVGRKATETRRRRMWYCMSGSDLEHLLVLPILAKRTCYRFRRGYRYRSTVSAAGSAGTNLLYLLYRSRRCGL